ncbi:F0F1 ATP synthase subunit delta [Aestuariivita boseongensis]|uniref:F0F1 ATP synthase subunit delta n=1 Tax=Aestuariivita boseongensis TaxID=1470562 RepID=UPI000682686F|nr:F0F1 ATP synthase subunit delta [Aestuariivita boseongensis]
MSEPASISEGIADRYATAIFEIAQENKDLDGLEASLADLSAALDASPELREVISSPILARSEQKAAMTALAQKMGLVQVMQNVLGLMAEKRRLFVLPQMIKALRAKIADHRGEVTAEVTSAKALTKAQNDKLAKTLAEKFGKNITIQASVDESIIGGLIVKVGSKMIDTSIKAKLNSLQNAMKEVG